MSGAAVGTNESAAVDTAAAPAPPAFRYVPEIDGLRTVAVVSVFVFHLNRGVLGGGFVGVDVFFVISGYLISSVLLSDIDQRRFSLIRFYQHRIARIAPALFLVALLTLLAGAALYSTQDFGSLAANAAAAAVSAINIKLLFQGSYFKISPDAQPLLHYWTLAVEEQFYLLFPPVLFVLGRWLKRPVLVTAVLCVASFALCVFVTRSHPVWAFYLLPTRAWELLAGAALALYRRGGGRVGPRWATGLGWAGIAILAASFFIIRESDDFPGWIAAAPVLGAVLVLAAVGQLGGVLPRLLAHPAAVFIGKRSYSLYLWHWPVFSFVDYALFEQPAWLRLGLKIGVSVAGALAAYELVEKPARNWLNRPDRRIAAFAGFAVAAVAMLIYGAEVRQHDYLSADPRDIAAGGIAAETGGRQSVVVVGDSQAAMYGAELTAIAHERGFRLNVLAAAGNSELEGDFNTQWPRVRQYLAAHPADVIVVAESWIDKAPNSSIGPDAAIAALEPFARRIVVIGQIPLAPANATRDGIRQGAGPVFFETPTDTTRRLAVAPTIDQLAVGAVSVVDVADVFIRPDHSLNLIGADGRFIYHDSDHLSDTGTRLLHARLDAALTAALASAQTGH